MLNRANTLLLVFTSLFFLYFVKITVLKGSIDCKRKIIKNIRDTSTDWYKLTGLYLISIKSIKRKQIFTIVLITLKIELVLLITTLFIIPWFNFLRYVIVYSFLTFLFLMLYLIIIKKIT